MQLLVCRLCPLKLPKYKIHYQSLVSQHSNAVVGSVSVFLVTQVQDPLSKALVSQLNAVVGSVGCVPQLPKYKIHYRVFL
jgi:hypothetical protein